MSKYEYVDSQKSDPLNQNLVVKMCLWLAVSTSDFYHWAIRPQSATAARREALITRIQHFLEESDGTYGYRRIHADLGAEQTECSPELVRQLMRQIGLVACQPRPFRITTEADAEAAASMPDLVKRDFAADRPDVKSATLLIRLSSELCAVGPGGAPMFLSSAVCGARSSRAVPARAPPSHRRGRLDDAGIPAPPSVAAPGSEDLWTSSMSPRPRSIPTR